MQLMRLWADLLCHSTGFLHLLRRCESKITVLMYHHVVSDEAFRRFELSNLAVPKQMFLRQVEWLNSHCTVVTVQDALENSQRLFNKTKPVVCLSFDDGYLDNYEIAAPILDAHDAKGTFFLTTGSIGTTNLLWFDQAALLWRSQHATAKWAETHAHLSSGQVQSFARSAEAWIGWLKILSPETRTTILQKFPRAGGIENERLYQLMSVEQAIDLRRRGHEIGSHTVSHPILTSLTPDAVRFELEHSRASLREWLGEEVGGFCYPNGSFNDATVQAVQQAGYKYACTTQRGANSPRADPWRLSRRHMFPESISDARMRHSPAAFQAEVFGMHDLQRRARNQLKAWRS